MSDREFMKLLFPNLIEKIEISEITPCLSDPERIKFLAQTDKPLGDVLPILYLSIPNAKYSEKLGSLSYTHQQHLITIFSTGKIGMTYVKDRNEAEQLIAEAKDLINRALIYLKKHGKPNPKLLESKKKLSPMEIYKMLPQTNCKECGEDGCYVFGIKLLSGEKNLNQCPYVKTSELEKMLYSIKL
ncbi:MAG: hypothetical protein OEX76_03385 [Candidatus Bathyarchaeota archaeon]|nr:hypothetical protein [Candidatus Bathyarchaeota archaeon]MDH5712860.1 hypothetical protein [Candidatus Bathyarchaeota archaeon]